MAMPRRPPRYERRRIARRGSVVMVRMPYEREG